MGSSDPPASADSQSPPKALPAAAQKDPTTADAQDDKGALAASKPQPPSASRNTISLKRLVFKIVVFNKIREYFLLRSGYKRAARAGWNGTKLVLGLLKETSDPFPPLKVAVAGLVALIDVFERTASNKAGMNDISRHIDKLLELFGDQLKGNRETALLFVEKPYVKDLTDHLSQLARMKEDGRILRFINSAQHEDDIKGVCQAIERTLQELQLDIGLSLERRTQDILREVVLQSLKRAESAAFDAIVSATVSRRSCTPGTREGVIDEIMKWALDLSPAAPPVYWMSGLAGQGKTTIAHTVCERLRALEDKCSVVSFFCSRQLDTKEEGLLVSTLAFKLAEVSATYASELLRVLPKDHDLSNRKLDVQMAELLVGPWTRSAASRPGLRPIVVVVDALDENDAGTQFIALILAASRTEEGLPGLRILLTSRPEHRIVPLCESIGDRAICRLNDIEPHIVHADILKYLNDELPRHQGKSYLVDVANTSNGLYIYASTIIRIVQSSRTPRTETEEASTLKQLADRTSAAKLYGDGTITILDALYKEIIDDAFRDLLPGEKDARERVLLTFICPIDTGPGQMLSILAFCADADEDLVHVVVDSLYPVLYIKDNGVFWHHASFQDYILATYKDLVHPTHMRIVRRCLVVWERLLDLAKDGRFAMDEDEISRLQGYVAEYQEILERDSPDWPTAGDPNHAPLNTWAAFYDCTLLDHVEVSDENWEHKWKTVSDFLSSLRLELQNDSQDMTG